MFIFKNLFLLDSFNVIDVIDILIVAFIIYYIYISISKTRALPVIQGFTVILMVTFIAAYFELNTLKSILEKIVSPMILSIVILFPSEIRSSFYNLGERIFLLKRMLKTKESSIEKITEALKELSKKKTGSIIVLEKNVLLKNIIDSGLILNANLEAKLIMSIFQRKSPLHDGAIIIRQDRIVAANCYIPNLASESASKKNYGSRHRASIGLSEQSDALVIVSSEESGKIALAYRSKLYENISTNKLSEKINEFFNK